MSILTGIAALMLTGAQLTTVDPPAADHPVARVGRRVIVHREIDCSLFVPNLRETAEQEQYSPEAVCLDREQRRLQLLMADALADAAIRKLGIESTAEEMESDAAAYHYGEDEFARLSTYYRGLAHAVLLVRRGQDLHAVYKQEVNGTISESEFRRFADLLPTVDAVERFIARHSPEHFRDSILADARRRLGRSRLRQILAAQAAQQGISLQARADAFWSDLAAETGVEVLDPRYQGISIRELSWSGKR